MGDDANIVHLNIIGHAVVQNPGGKDYVVRPERIWGRSPPGPRPLTHPPRRSQTYIIDLQQGSAGWQIFRRFASFVALGHVVRGAGPSKLPPGGVGGAPFGRARRMEKNSHVMPRTPAVRHPAPAPAPGRRYGSGFLPRRPARPRRCSAGRRPNFWSSVEFRSNRGCEKCVCPGKAELASRRPTKGDDAGLRGAPLGIVPVRSSSGWAKYAPFWSFSTSYRPRPTCVPQGWIEPAPTVHPAVVAPPRPAPRPLQLLPHGMGIPVMSPASQVAAEVRLALPEGGRGPTRR